MTTIGKKLIEDLYEDEAHNRMTEATLVKVTLQGNVEDIAMMNAIAERALAKPALPFRVKFYIT